MSENFIPTRGSQGNKEASNLFKFTNYTSHKSKKVATATIPDDKKEAESQPLNEFNIKKAKHEVIKFGTSGFDPDKKEEARIQLAVKLGAKPPKNKYKNYKLLKEERAKLKKAEMEKSTFQQLGKNALGKATAKTKGFNKKRRKVEGGLLDVYGKVKTVDKA